MLTPQITSSGRYRLGDLELDVDQRRLTRHGHDLKLSKLTFRALHVLASSAPGLVTNDELANRVWGGAQRKSRNSTPTCQAAPEGIAG